MKKLFIILIAALFVLPVAVMGQDIRSHWIADSDPGTTELGDPPWGAENEVGHLVGAGADVWIGINNEFRWVNMKTLTVVITGPNVHQFQKQEVLGRMKGGMFNNHEVLVWDDTVPNVLTIVVKIFPQPVWEVIHITNVGGAATIEEISAESECEYIPTTTTYGLALLALLLIGSTVWVLRRRRAGAVA